MKKLKLQCVRYLIVQHENSLNLFMIFFTTLSPLRYLISFFSFALFQFSSLSACCSSLTHIIQIGWNWNGIENCTIFFHTHNILVAVKQTLLNWKWNYFSYQTRRWACWFDFNFQPSLDFIFKKIQHKKLLSNCEAAIGSQLMKLTENTFACC